jgi:hypothetical protein
MFIKRSPSLLIFLSMLCCQQEVPRTWSGFAYNLSDHSPNKNMQPSVLAGLNQKHFASCTSNLFSILWIYFSSWSQRSLTFSIDFVFTMGFYMILCYIFCQSWRSSLVCKGLYDFFVLDLLLTSSMCSCLNQLSLRIKPQILGHTTKWSFWWQLYWKVNARY